MMCMNYLYCHDDGDIFDCNYLQNLKDMREYIQKYRLDSDDYELMIMNELIFAIEDTQRKSIEMHRELNDLFRVVNKYENSKISYDEFIEKIKKD